MVLLFSFFFVYSFYCSAFVSFALVHCCHWWLCVDAVGGGGSSSGSVVVHSLYLYLSLYASVRFLHLFGFCLLDFKNNAGDYEFIRYTTS